MSTPQSVIYICSNVRIDSRYDHSIFFASAAAQQEYFAGKVVKTLSAYSYVRKSWPLKVEATMEEAKRWNYLFFRNTGSGKTYYYFIDTIEYINDGTVELGLTLDVIQTYLFDFNLGYSFVDRQHTESDIIGANTVDEGLELGELVSNSNGDFTLSDQPSDYYIMVLSSVYMNGTSAETTLPVYSYVYNNVFSGLHLSAVDVDSWAAVGIQLQKLADWGKLDGVITMWMYPKELVSLASDPDNYDFKTVTGVNTPTYTLPALASNNPATMDIDGYKPRNKKLYCYPYNFLYVTNNTGGSAVYQYERFNAAPSFRIFGALSPDAGYKAVPLNYKGAAINYDEGVSTAPFPTCAWNADIYKMWLAQNQATHDLTNIQGGAQIAAGAAATVAGALTLNATAALGGVATALNGANQIAALVAAKKDMSVQPPQARGNFSASVNMANSKACLTWYAKSVTAEHAKIIDKYFDMYGYKINCYRVPNIAARPAYTYVKTIGANIIGHMCNEDITKIAAIFDKGITFWKNGDLVGNYAQENTV